MKFSRHIMFSTALLGLLSAPVQAAQDLSTALRRAQYLLTGTMPTDQEFTSNAVSDAAYKTAVRTFLDGEGDVERSLLRALLL